MAFREPRSKNAKITLTIIIALLAILLAGIALLCRSYGIAATDPEKAGYESVLSMLTRAVMGHGWFYYVTIAGVLLVLALSANTAFADFPRLTRAIAHNDYMPHVFLLRGRRLLYSWGIYILVALTALLLIIFRGVTDRLIPLYAIGAFMAFTLSQAGMVMHWWKQDRTKTRGIGLKMLMNGLGAFATGITTLVVLVAKFLDGAWITVILVAALILMMRSVRRHYDVVDEESVLDRPFARAERGHPVMIVPVDKWNRITEKALSFALSMSDDIRCVHVQVADEPDTICSTWDEYVTAPLKAEGRTVPQLKIIKSPYRTILQPIVDYIHEVERETEHQKICVLVPEMMVKHWWEGLMHNHRASLLKVLLLMKGNPRTFVINIPWYLDVHSR